MNASERESEARPGDPSPAVKVSHSKPIIAPENSGKLAKIGFTEAGCRFVVPETHDIFVSLIDPRCWGLAEVFTTVVMALHILTLFLAKFLPLWFYVLQFLTYRLAYNVGLGLILHFQSHHKFITTWLRDSSPEMRKLVRRIVSSSMGSDYSWNKVPTDYNAWLVFRILAMHILANDGLTYLVLCLKVMGAPSERPFQFLVGLIVFGVSMVFTIWSKIGAHLILGDFAWHWGDFFYLLEGDLNFDGVFECFPHPMYTVGYLGYYGMSFLTRSHTLLLVSLLAHSLQLLFLYLVEEPHINRTYGSKEEVSETTKLSQWIAKIPGAEAFSYLSYLDPTTTFCLVANLVLALALKLPARYFVANLLLWRVFHWTMVPVVLHMQAGCQSWTKFHATFGLSDAEAFERWGKLYTVSYVMNSASFYALGFCLWTPVSGFGELFSSTYLCGVVGGLFLISIAQYSLLESLPVIGSHGFVYGDFFLPKLKSDMCYHGVHRFLNNPELVLGYAGHYGMCLISSSWLLATITLLTHLVHIVFVFTVEEPHLDILYPERRQEAALERILRTQAGRGVPEPLKLSTSKAAADARRTIIAGASDITGIVSKQSKTVVGSLQAQNTVLQKQAQDVGHMARSKLQAVDGSIIELVRKSGMTEKLLSDFEDGDIPYESEIAK